MGPNTAADEVSPRVADPAAEWHLPERETIPRKPTDDLWQRLLAWVFFLTGFAFFFFVRSTVSTEVSFTIATTEALLLMLGSQAILMYLYRRISNHMDEATGLRRLRSKVPEDSELQVRVRVVREGSVTGCDKGFMWLSEGTWYFKGLQCAFRFNQQDVVPVESWGRSIAPDPSRDKAPRVIPMRGKDGPYVLHVDVLNPYEDYAKRKLVKTFYRQMYDWLHERPQGEIESLLPPTTVHPSLLRRGFFKVEGLVAAAVMMLLDSMVLFGLPRGGFETNLGTYGLMAALLVTAALFLTVRFAWSELRDIAVRDRLTKVAEAGL